MEAQKGQFKGSGWGRGVGQGPLWKLLLIMDPSLAPASPGLSHSYLFSHHLREGSAAFLRCVEFPIFSYFNPDCRFAEQQAHREEQKKEPRDSQHLSQSCFHLDLSEPLTRSQIDELL